MRKRDFQRLFKKYGASAIASILEVSPSTVRRWRLKGVPAAQEKHVKNLDTIRKHEGYEEKSLREMMSLAKEAGKLPKVKTYAKRRDGERTTGFEVSKAGKEWLTEKSLLKLTQHLQKAKMAKGLPNWLASVTVSAFVNEAERAGSGDVRYQVDHADADNFVVESIISSGLQGSRKKTIESVIGKLRQKMKESDSKFYIHGSYFSTYQYKTKTETLDLQRERRKRRKK
jgi:hypothetical protein